jgi:hypothetical protein
MFEDEQDQGGDGQQQAPPMPQPPDPWTTADGQRLDRLNQGLSGLQTELDEGKLTKEEFEPLYQRVNGMRAPLLQKQQAHAEQAQNMAKMQALHANAMARGVEQQDARFDAQGFGDRMYRYVDERSGNEQAFYQTEKGRWAPIPPAEQGGDGEGGDNGVKDFVNSLAGSAEEDQQDTENELEAGDGAGAPGGGDQTPPGGFWSQQTIGNGPDSQQIIRDGQGRIIYQPGQGGSEQARDPLFGIDQKTHQQIEAFAEAQTMHMRPGAHKEIAKARIKGQAIAGVIQQNARKERLADAQKIIDSKAAAAEKRLSATQRAAKNAGFTPHDVYDMLKKEGEDIKTSKESIDKFRHEGVDYGGKIKDLPHDVQDAIAEERVRKRLERIGNQQGPGADAGPGRQSGSSKKYDNSKVDSLLGSMMAPLPPEMAAPPRPPQSWPQPGSTIDQIFGAGRSMIDEDMKQERARNYRPRKFE